MKASASQGHRFGLVGLRWVGVLVLTAALGCGETGKKGNKDSAVDSGTAYGGEDGRRLDGPGAEDRPVENGEVFLGDARKDPDTRPDSVAPDGFTTLPDAFIGTDTVVRKDAAIMDTAVASDTPVKLPDAGQDADSGAGDVDASWIGGPTGLGGASGTVTSTAPGSTGGSSAGGANGGGGSPASASSVGGTAGASGDGSLSVGGSSGAAGASSGGAGGSTVGCIPGYHDGGKGCVLVGGCSVGYHDNGSGICIINENWGTVVDAAVAPDAAPGDSAADPCVPNPCTGGTCTTVLGDAGASASCSCPPGKDWVSGLGECLASCDSSPTCSSATAGATCAGLSDSYGSNYALCKRTCEEDWTFRWGYIGHGGCVDSGIPTNNPPPGEYCYWFLPNCKLPWD
jgi:hypothetical protein